MAKNGQGKSSVLDAIRIGLWSFVSGFDLARNLQNDPANGIRIDDVRILKKHNGEMVRQLPCSICLKSDWHSWGLDDSYWGAWSLWVSNLRDESIRVSEWMRHRESEVKRTKTKDDTNSFLLKKFASFLQDEIRHPNSADYALPVFGYYGTGRLWSQKRLTEDKKIKANNAKQDADFFMRLFAYRDCLDPSSSYKHFAEWFTWIFECYREQQINEQEKGISEGKSVWQDTIQVIQQAINTLLQGTGWHSLEYSVSYGKTLIMKHDEYGVLSVEQLSDGIRSVLATGGDIAYRCIKLNPHLGLNAAKETRGVIMIDEVDMHLHPAWQQTVLVDLCKAFPKIQFIVTTHSPQVLSSIHRKSIRLLGRDSEGRDVATMPLAESYGEISSDILESVMHVNPQPPVAEKSKLDRLTALVDQGLYDTEEAQNLFVELKIALSETHPQLKKLARSVVRRQEMLQL